MSSSREVTHQTDSRLGRHQQDARDLQRRRLEALGLVAPGDSTALPKKRDNVLALTAGEHATSQPVDVADTHVKGVAPGAVILLERALVVSEDARFTDVMFATAGAYTGALVQVTNGACAQFIGCSFRKRPSDSATHITFAAGTKGALVAPWFADEAAAVGNVIDNAAALGDVVVHAAVNKTGNSLGTVTVS